jgi:hypothetical protein
MILLMIFLASSESLEEQEHDQDHEQEWSKAPAISPRAAMRSS